MTFLLPNQQCRRKYQTTRWDLEKADVSDVQYSSYKWHHTELCKTVKRFMHASRTTPYIIPCTRRLGNPKPPQRQLIPTNRHHFTLSLSFNSHFPGGPGLSATVDFIGAKGDGNGGEHCSYKTCKTPVKSSPPTNQQHPTSYRPDALPVD